MPRHSNWQRLSSVEIIVAQSCKKATANPERFGRERQGFGGKAMKRAQSPDQTPGMYTVNVAVCGLKVLIKQTANLHGSSTV